jgi:hypothetical protein
MIQGRGRDGSCHGGARSHVVFLAPRRGALSAPSSGAAMMTIPGWGNSRPSYTAMVTGSVRAITKASPMAVQASSPAAAQRVPDSLTKAEWDASWGPMLSTMPLGVRPLGDRND